MPKCKSLGKRIWTARTDKHMSQERLSEILECYPRLIVEWEYNKIVPSAHHLRDIALALDVSVDWLLGIEHEKEVKRDYS